MPCPCCFWSCKPQGQRMEAAGMNRAPPLAGPPQSRLILCVLALFLWRFAWEPQCRGSIPRGWAAGLDTGQGWCCWQTCAWEMWGKSRHLDSHFHFFKFNSTSKLLFFSCAAGIHSPAPTQLLSPLCPTVPSPAASPWHGKISQAGA